VLVRPDAGTARFLAVPHPEQEPHTLDLALHLLRELDASALLLAAAGPAGAASDAVAEDPASSPAWTADLFASAHRVALTAGQGAARAVGLQVRGRAGERDLAAHLAMTMGVLTPDLDAAAPGLAAVVRELGGMGLGVQLDDGRRGLADLHGYGIPEVRLARNLDGLPLAVLWASPEIRRRFAAEDGLALTRAARAAGIPVEEPWMDRWWATAVPAGARVEGVSLLDPPQRLGADWRPVLATCAALMRTADLRFLPDLARQASEHDIELRWLVDRESGLPLLWLRRGAVAAAVDLLAPDAGWSGPLERPVAALRTGLIPLVLVEEAGEPAHGPPGSVPPERGR
jgi:hypothetical protein